jgi:hypothetical protein
MQIVLASETLDGMKINEVCCVCGKFTAIFTECVKCRLAAYCSSACESSSTHVCDKRAANLKLMRTIVTVLANKLNNNPTYHDVYKEINGSRSVRRIRSPKMLIVLITSDSRICDVLDNLKQHLKVATLKEMECIFKKYDMPFPNDWDRVTGVVLFRDTIGNSGISFGIIGS